jgi:hypothetical protein
MYQMFQMFHYLQTFPMFPNNLKFLRLTFLMSHLFLRLTFLMFRNTQTFQMYPMFPNNQTCRLPWLQRFH